MATLAAICLAASTASCASMFLNGARMANAHTPVDHAIATYSLQACTSADGSTVAAPAGISYVLLQGEHGNELFERSADGSGAIIGNRWEDATGAHYFVWVQRSGWEFVLPPAGGRAMRLVYSGMHVERFPDGTSRPQGAIAASCPLGPVSSGT